ncbi:MAG: hypothetical protein AB2L13_01130 [Spirochaetota bacterium]
MDIKGDMSFILLSLNKEMAANLKYHKHINDINLLDSKTNYLMSRYYDKLLTMSCNYIKIYSLLNHINLTYIDNFNFENTIIDFNSLKRESDIELISILLRPSIEMYLEIRSLEIALTKGVDTEVVSTLIMEYSFFENYCNILENCNDFYNCKPLFYKRYRDEVKTHYEQLKKTLNEKGIPILKKINKKYLAILTDDEMYEKLILGKDFYNLYSYMSRKIHFSKFSYPASDNIDSNIYLTWAVFLMLNVYNSIFKIYNVKSEIIEILKGIIDGFRQTGIYKNPHPVFNLHEILLFDFGVAKVTKNDPEVIHVQYLYANYLKPGDIDIIPKDFIRKIIENGKLHEMESKYKKGNLSIEQFNDKLIKNNEYVNFWNDLLTC